MKFLLPLVLLVAPALYGQDSSFSEIRIRASAFRNPVSGHLADDWKAGTGVQGEMALSLAVGEVGVAIGRLSYAPTTGKPPYTATLFGLTWVSPELLISRLALSGGIRLVDYRMDFDDPAIGEGLTTEEEMMAGVTARVRAPVYRRLSAFGDATASMLMLGTRTPMILVHVGLERSFGSPAWLRDFLR